MRFLRCLHFDRWTATSGRRLPERAARTRPEVAFHLTAVAILLLAQVALRAAELPQLRGVLTIGAEWHAAIVAGDTGAPRWCRPGDRIGGFTLIAVDAEAVTLVGADGAPRVLHLPAPKIANRDAPPRDPAVWEQWVISPANPMLDTPAPLPVTPHQWLALATERQSALAEWYRLHGWSVDVRVEANDGIVVEFNPLHGEARHAARAELQQAFLRSLSPDQRTLHTAARQPGARASAVQALANSLDPVRQLKLAELFGFSVPLPHADRPSP